MNQKGVLVIVFLFFFFLLFNVEAQDTSHLHAPKPIRPSLAVIIGILSVMFCLTFIILAYAKCCTTPVPNQLTHDQNPRGLLRSRSRFSGVDKKVIESLPFFRYSSLNGSKEGLECVVCLSKFEETEILRLLPKCRHAFHLNCIDKWLESHSSCPLCRYKFDVGDLTSFTYMNSLRYPPNSPEGPNLELFVRREQDQHHRSLRFNIGSSFRKFGMSRKEELLIPVVNNSYDDHKLLHKFKHRIIVSDIVHKSRWSDVNSSDLMFLNCEMINVMSSKRFSPANTNSEKLQTSYSMTENIVKIKKDMDRKRLYESKVSKFPRSKSLSTSSFTSNNGANLMTTSRSLNSANKRSMSEITNLSRFTEFSAKNGIKGSLFCGKDERMRRVWLPIARRTVQWFSSQERSSLQSENKRHQLNV